MSKRKRYSFVLSKDEKESLVFLSDQMGVISLAAVLRRLIFDAVMVSKNKILKEDKK